MRWMLILSLAIFVACGKKEEEKSGGTYVNTQSASGCINMRLLSHYCYYNACHLVFPNSYVRIVPYGVYYNNHIYKVCPNGTVSP